MERVGAAEDRDDQFVNKLVGVEVELASDKLSASCRSVPPPTHPTSIRLQPPCDSGERNLSPTACALGAPPPHPHRELPSGKPSSRTVRSSRLTAPASSSVCPRRVRAMTRVEASPHASFSSPCPVHGRRRGGPHPVRANHPYHLRILYRPAKGRWAERPRSHGMPRGSATGTPVESCGCYVLSGPGGSAGSVQYSWPVGSVQISRSPSNLTFHAVWCLSR